MRDRLLSAKIREYAPANPVEQEGIRAWSADFFLHHLARMNAVSSEQ